MARTALTEIHTLEDATQSLDVTAGAADIAFEAGDDVDGNEVQCTGKELVFVRNDDAGPQTITFTARDDVHGRGGSISAYSLAAGDHAVFGPFSTEVWRQTDGMLYIDVSDANVMLSVVRIP